MCEVLEKMRFKTKVNDKLELLELFLSKVGRESAFPFMRLILPEVKVAGRSSCGSHSLCSRARCSVRFEYGPIPSSTGQESTLIAKRSSRRPYFGSFRTSHSHVNLWRTRRLGLSLEVPSGCNLSYPPPSHTLCLRCNNASHGSSTTSGTSTG